MFKVYEITLCKEEGVMYDDIFQTSFVIKFKYKMPSSSRWIGSRSLSEINKHYTLSDDELYAYKQQFNNFFPSVKNGDEILMEFNPQLGVKFYYNDRFFGNIKNQTLAIRFSNIWLHPNSTFVDTRNFLLDDE